MSAVYSWLAGQPPQVRNQIANALDQSERNELDWHWEMLAREEQLPPPGEWRTWLIMAGRGFGKTRAGAEWVRQIAESDSEARIALVSSSLAEARNVMVEGESGLLACSPPDRRPVYEAVRIAGDWHFISARSGMSLFDAATGSRFYYNSQWQSVSEPAPPSGGTNIDVEARSTLSELVEALKKAGIFPNP